MDREEVNTWLSRIAARFRHFRSDADLQEELQAHLAMQSEENIDAGMPPAEARRRARLKLGNTQSVVENVRDQEFITMVESWYRDFVLGLRALGRSPVFCLTAVLTLAIGIGANTAVFTLLHGLLLRGLPVEEPQQLVRINMVSAEFTAPGIRLPYRMVQHLRGRTQTLTDISSWEMSTVPIEDREGTLRQYHIGLVGGNSFELLGMRPYFGRLLTSTDDVRGGPAEGWPAVLSYGFWRERMGGDREAIGKTIRVSGAIVTVVGVAPPDFHGVWPGFEPKLYFPFQFSTVLNGRDDLNSPTGSVFCNAIGRLKPGVSAAEAHAEISARGKDLLNEFLPARYQRLPFFRTAGLSVESARTGFPTFFGQTYSAPLYLMQGLVAVVLLLCCVNVSGLMMSKIYQRQHEFAVRTAMGAARWRVIRQYLTESFAIAAAGAGLAAGVTWYGSGLLLQFFRHPNMGTGMSLEPDRTVFLVTAVFAVITTLFFGILPAWRAGRSDPSTLLKSRTSAGRRRTVGQAFIPIQVSLSVVLVTLATLLSQSLVRIRGEHTGFDVDHVTIQTPPFHRLPQKGDALLDLYQRMVDRIEQSPGIQSAAVTLLTPMTGTQLTARFQAIAEGPTPPEDPSMAYNHVGPGYFRTMKTTIVSGREFEKNQREPDVCVLNQAAANHLFPRQSALGQYVRSDDEKRFPKPVSCRVVGIAADAKFAHLREPPPRTIYFPVSKEQLINTNFVFLMNSQTKAQAVAAYREALREIAPSVPLVLFVTLREQMDAALGSQIAITLLSNFFGVLALLLSAIGLYGVLSSSVAQRTGEIGVRVALGASRIAVLRMILTDALRLVGAGTALGCLALYFAVQYIENMLYGVSAFDPVTLVATGCVLTVVALIAGLIPALRAASIDPIRALRAE